MDILPDTAFLPVLPFMEETLDPCGPRQDPVTRIWKPKPEEYPVENIDARVSGTHVPSLCGVNLKSVIRMEQAGNRSPLQRLPGFAFGQ